MDTALDAWAVGVAEGEESHEGPGGLGCGGGAAAFEDGVFVGIAAFAPAAIGVLDTFQPVAGFEDPRFVHIDLEGTEAAEGLPGSVDVIDAPAAVPGSVGFLLVTEVLEGFGDLGVVGGEVFVAEELEDARGDIGAFGVEHGVVVGEGDFFQDIFGAVFIEGGPAAVFALEAEHPGDGSIEDFLGAFGVIGGDEPQGEEDHGGVIDIRVPFIFELEGPAAGFDVGGVFVFPVAAEADFAIDHPIHGLGDPGVVFGYAGFAEADESDDRIPDWGEAGFEPDLVFGFVVEFVEVIVLALDFRVVVGVAEGFEGDDGVEDSREDGGEAIGAFEAFEHPVFRLFEGHFAEGSEAVVFDEFVEPIEPEEEVAPGEAFGVGWEGQVAFVEAFGVEFVEGNGGVERAGRFEVIDNGEGDEHGAGPGAHFPEVHVEPFADEDDLAGDRGHVIPGEEAEECEVEFGERIHAGDAAHAEGDFPGFEHTGVGDGDPGEFEGEVGLDGGVYLGGAAMVEVPAAIGQLVGEEVVDGFLLPLGIDLIIPVIVADHVGDDGGIHHEFAHPVAVFELQVQEVVLRLLDGLLQSIRGRSGFLRLVLGHGIPRGG